MLRDPSHIFRRLWAAKPYAFRHSFQPTCFERSRDEGGRRAIDPRVFANETRDGTHCDVNWYEGNEGVLGAAGRTPYFSNIIAPALLGFDESIDAFCTWERVHYQDSKSYADSHAGSCVNANHNILSLYGDRVPYNLCRNLEWQVCASRGLLPGQGGKALRFSYPPSLLSVYGDKPLGQCGGWRPPDAEWGCADGYATDDIFFAEVCMQSFYCNNGAALFMLERGEFYECDFSPDRFDELMRLLFEDPIAATVDSRRDPPSPPPSTTTH